MKKFFLLLSTGVAMAFVSCASAPAKKSCCGSCGGEAKACCTDGSCSKCTD